MSPGSAGAQATTALPASDAPTGKGPQVVSLITGDRVTVHGNGRISVVPRKGIYFADYRTPGHHFIIPSDALPLLKADRLDRRLFDLTELVAASKAEKSKLSLIVAGAASAPGLTAERRLPAVRGFSSSIATDQLGSRWQTTKKSLTSGKIWLDAVRQPALDVSVPLIGAPTAWAAGYDGTGVTVAVLDTGIDSAHPDLAGKISAEHNFTEGEEDDLDHVGHGTHVATTIAGSGAASAGKYKGVAPGAKLLDGKVCVQFGCAESWILAGMQWGAESGAKVISMSLGGSNGPEIDPLEQAVNDLTAQFGTLFVIAAGNDGTDESVSSPATADAALAVAAFTKEDELAEFSSRGPRAEDNGIKPEIAAPGQDIVAGRSKDGFLGEPGELYMPLSGTSMATPHVAGSAAILTQVHPQWSPAQRKAALMAAAKPNPTVGVFAQGAGRVDIGRAITQSVTTTPVSVGFGLQDWPHEDDPVRSQTISYHNYAATAVTLSLALTTTAPAGMFSLSAPTVTVPAGGDAGVTLTADTRVGGAATGYFGGQVTATAAGTSVQTPFAVIRDELKYVVHHTATQRDGQPAENAFSVYFNTDTYREYLVYGAAKDLRLPPGNYFAFSWIDEGDSSEDLQISQLTYPKLVIAADKTVSMDARLGKGFNIKIPATDAVELLADYEVSLTLGEYGYGVGVVPGSFSQLYTAHLGPRNVAGLLSFVAGVYVKGDSSGWPAPGSPYSYQVGWSQTGSAIEGITKNVKAKDLATVNAKYAASGVSGTEGFRLDFFAPPGSNGGTASAVPTPLPFAQTHYFLGGTRWVSESIEEVPNTEGWPPTIVDTLTPARVYTAGRTHSEQWNQGVFGPSLGAAPFDYIPVGRDGDVIYGVPELIGDGLGRLAFGEYSSGRGALYRNGQLVEEWDGPYGQWDVPAGLANYRLEASLTRIPEARLSTKVSAAWTFSSKHTDKDTGLPLTTVSFAPELDQHNVARAGAVVAIPITVGQVADSGAGQLNKLAVDVSTNDGATWQKAIVLKIAGKWLLFLKNPNAAGFVSLRANGSDTKGNTFTETIIRAYEVR
ncbi:hypothetical protein F4553_005224 [Allocatelliglobosispora scoriae]|uniref:Peptidase S8/S53 domain-containing protein n=1 Tax=Allocatelliglobosispora scoriae TaxID=643052 RepID=A0A841BVZ3_9ACTN|nr:S8 family serine peptidase [Allocatelliglobosispora scoriae]MBB5871845.1 hypothetical protein [Allocatelliglobosispora scoriae]